MKNLFFAITMVIGMMIVTTGPAWAQNADSVVVNQDDSNLPLRQGGAGYTGGKGECYECQAAAFQDCLMKGENRARCLPPKPRTQEGEVQGKGGRDGGTPAGN